jgi:5-methylcytosine-specific restriction endonuclease McrA
MPMTTAQKRELAQSRRAECIRILGGVCVDCGTTEKLARDHVFRTDRQNHPRRTARWQREKIYLEEAKAGKLVLRCPPCHGRKSARERREGDQLKIF